MQGWEQTWAYDQEQGRALGQEWEWVQEENWGWMEVPEAVPMPMRDSPASAMMALTSAKSTFTRPGTWPNGRAEQKVTKRDVD